MGENHDVRWTKNPDGTVTACCRPAPPWWATAAGGVVAADLRRTFTPEACAAMGVPPAPPEWYMPAGAASPFVVLEPRDDADTPVVVGEG